MGRDAMVKRAGYVLAGLLLVGVMTLGAPAPGEAISYTFTKIADTTAELEQFFEAPSIDNAGTVAFRALFDAAFGTGIFKGGGGALTEIAKTGDPVGGSRLSAFTSFGRPSIRSGAVSFIFGASPQDAGIGAGAGGAVDILALGFFGPPVQGNIFTVFSDGDVDTIFAIDNPSPSFPPSFPTNSTSTTGARWPSKLPSGACSVRAWASSRGRTRVRTP